MATHSGFLALEIPWTEEPSMLPSMGSQRVGRDLVTKQQQQIAQSEGGYKKAFHTSLTIMEMKIKSTMMCKLTSIRTVVYHQKDKEQQTLAKMYRKRNNCVLLVGM